MRYGVWHFLVGLAAMVAAVVLALAKVIAGTDALMLITTVAGVLLGASSALMPPRGGPSS